MKNSCRWFRRTSLGLLVLVCGCGSETAPPVKPVAAPVNDVTPQPTGELKTTDAGKSIPQGEVKQDSALSTVTQTLAAIERGDLAGAYEFLPPSYQSDVDDLVHEFAEQMDADVWARLFGTLTKAIKVLRTRKTDIFELDLFANRSEYEPMRKHWDEALTLLEQFATSSASDLKALRQSNAKSLLPGNASRVVEQLDAIGLGIGADLARQFSGIKVEQIKATADEQLLSFRGPGDEKPVEIAYIKHEGRWLPKTLVAQWPAGIEADRVWLAKLPEQIKAAKPRILQALAVADSILDQLLAANNREEFQQAAGPAILSLALAWPRLQDLARESAAGRVGLPPVTVSVNRELTEREQTQLIEAVFQPLQATGTDYTLLANDGRTICRLTRINDMASLGEKLTKHFGLKPEAVAIDLEAARITIMLGK